MPVVSAANVSPIWAVPLMVGAPVAGLLSRSGGVSGAGASGVSMWNQRERSLVPCS